MPFTLQSLAALKSLPFDDLVDVRSPAEYAEDHLPGAISLPVLSDAERAEVGTIYTRESPFRARKIGAALVARNAAAHLQGPLAEKEGGWRPLVYCWRGGQRSGSLASILAQVGWRTETLAGGYQSYRRLVVEALYESPLAHRLILIDGNTGTAKTELLGLLGARGHQVVDLEALARHRGSVFGARPGGQPGQKAFDSALALALAGFDPARPVLMEAESSKIGARLIPPSVWAAMRMAPRVELEAPLAERARYLVRAYGDVTADRDGLDATLAALIPLQGRERVEAWQALAAAGELERLAAELMEHHYDPRYAKARSRGNPGGAVRVALAGLAPEMLEAGADAVAGAVTRLAASEHAD